VLSHIVQAETRRSGASRPSYAGRRCSRAGKVVRKITMPTPADAWLGKSAKYYRGG
jgi:hypothetical protein